MNIKKKLQANKSPRLNGFIAEFYQTVKKNPNTYPSQTIPKISRGRKTSKLFL